MHLDQSYQTVNKSKLPIVIQWHIHRLDSTVEFGCDDKMCRGLETLTDSWIIKSNTSDG